MVRKTSIIAYQKIKDKGLLGRMQFAVYHKLYLYGPVTAMELKALMDKEFKADSQIRSRLTELREMGVAQEIGRKICSITGNNVILWDVTEKTPVKERQANAHRVKCEHCDGSGYL